MKRDIEGKCCVPHDGCVRCCGAIFIMCNHERSTTKAPVLSDQGRLCAKLVNFVELFGFILFFYVDVSSNYR